MEHVLRKKQDLYDDVHSFVQQYCDSRIQQYWQLLDVFAKFLELHK